MWIFFSIFLVSGSINICSRFYKKMFPGIKLISTELVLIPFGFKMPDVTERLRQDSVGRTRASNLVFTIWAVFGGFILHFLLSNYLTVLLRPSYEEPVETAADLIKRDITPFYSPGGEILTQFFAASSDPNYQEISQRLVITKDWDEYFDMYDKVATTGLLALVAPAIDPWYVPEEEFKNWYRSSEALGGFNPYGGHLTNKNFPLKKKYDLNILRFTQAGLLMITKQFNQFVWKENVQILGMPHFYLAFMFLGSGSVISIIVFVCENLRIKKIRK